jgi:hypothetical protein
MEYNRFDGLQSDIAVAYLRDGMTFVMSQYDDVSKREVLAQELAYDGDTGMIVVYERGSASLIAAAELESAQHVVEEMEARLAVCRARRDEARARVERERAQLVAAQTAYEAARATHPQAAEAFDARAALEAALKGGV